MQHDRMVSYVTRYKSRGMIVRCVEKDPSYEDYGLSSNIISSELPILYNGLSIGSVK